MALPNLLTKEKVTAHIALRLQPSPETHAEGWTLPHRGGALRCGAGRTRPGQASGAGGAFPAPSPGVYLRRAAVEKNCLFHTPLKKEKKEKKRQKKNTNTKKWGSLVSVFPTLLLFLSWRPRLFLSVRALSQLLGTMVSRDRGQRGSGAVVGRVESRVWGAPGRRAVGGASWSIAAALGARVVPWWQGEGRGVPQLRRCRLTAPCGDSENYSLLQ